MRLKPMCQHMQGDWHQGGCDLLDNMMLPLLDEELGPLYGAFSPVTWLDRSSDNTPHAIPSQVCIRTTAYKTQLRSSGNVLYVKLMLQIDHPTVR